MKQQTCKIWLDSRVMPNSGIKRYVDTLTTVGKKLFPEYELHTWEDSFSTYNGKRISPFFAICRMLYEIFILPFVLKKAHISIFHCTKNFGLPVFAKCKKVLTVHDLIPLDLKEYAGGFSKLYYYWNYKISCYGADKILCISELTKKRLLHYFPNVASKTQVIYQGASHISSQEKQNDLTHKQTQKPYILMMGGAEPRKNIRFAANCILSDERFDQYELVIIGGVWHGKTLPSAITENPKVHCLGKVSDEKLNTLYREASAFVFPSIYEGFGLPIFEAAAFGVPTLAANASVIPELINMPEMLFTPGNVKDFCEKLNNLLKSATLKSRIVAEMEKLLKKFSWNNTVFETFSVYRELLREGKNEYEESVH